MAGLFIVAISMLDTETCIIGKFNFCLYYLATAIYPRMLFTVPNFLLTFLA